MKKLIVTMAVAIASCTFYSAKGQKKMKTIKLEQTPGEFTVKGFTLKEGSYIFEISNNGVDHPVGFGIAPKDHPDLEHAISTVTNGGRGLNNGESDKTEVVTLKKGKYVYWCPANPTKQYEITVE